MPYFIGIVRTLAVFRPRPMRFVVDGQPLERRALGVAVANGPSYGGGMRIAPGAAIDDGLFDVCLIGHLHPMQLLALLPRLYAGTHAGHHAVEFFRCRELRSSPWQRATWAARRMVSYSERSRSHSASRRAGCGASWTRIREPGRSGSDDLHRRAAVAERARATPAAFSFLSDDGADEVALTYAELESRARGVAALLRAARRRG